MEVRNGRFAPRALSVLAVLALTGGIAACGSDDKKSSDSASNSSAAGTQTTQAAESTDPTFAKYSAPFALVDPKDPVEAASGKKITIIICGAAGATCVRVGNGAKEAAEALGYQVSVVDGRSQPSVWNQTFQSAIASKSDGIVLAAVPPGLVGGAMAKAKSAGVKVAAVLSTAGPKPDVAVEIDRNEVSEGNSAFLAKDSGGKAQLLLVRDDEFPETKLSQDGYKTQLPKICPGCKIVDEVSFTLALAAQRLAGNVAAKLKNNPGINYVALPFDAVAPFVIQGIREAGRAGKVKIIGVGGDPTSIDAMKSGDMVESFGTPAELMGWMAVDGLVRQFAGKPQGPRDERVISDYKVPQRFVVADKLPDTPTWDAGGFDYRSEFKKLWGK
jgi:ribose transport system substrate-binding protein